MNFLGIDPGLNGGLAFIEKGKLILHKTPVIGGRDYDIQGMKYLLTEPPIFEPMFGNSGLFAVIENQISMPGQGLTSTLTTGKGFGIWLGLLAGLDIPYQVVGARQWQVKLFTGVSGKLDTKQKSEVVAKRLFPKADFRKSDRATKADDGLTDAACIAEYARRIHGGGDIHREVPEVTGIGCVALESNPDVCIKCGRYIPDSIPNNCQQLSFLKNNNE